jgi:hypothetical protein
MPEDAMVGWVYLQIKFSLPKPNTGGRLPSVRYIEKASISPNPT